MFNAWDNTDKSVTLAHVDWYYFKNNYFNKLKNNSNF